MAQARLDLLFFRRLLKLFGKLFGRYNSRPAIIFYILVILSLALQFVIYAAGLIPSKFFEVLGAKDFPAFQQLSVYAILVIVLNAVMKSMMNYVSRVLYLSWRQQLCSELHEQYFKNKMFYELNVLDNSLDNMDQRITRDANMFTKEWSLLMSRLVVLPFTLVYYSYQCFVSTTWLGPVIIYIYFIVGTIINRLIMAPIVRLNVDQEVWEGNYRYQHLNVRVNAESMAFYRAGDIEHSKSNTKLATLLRTLMSLYNWSFWLNSSVNIFDYVGGILSYLIIAIPLFSGDYDHLAPEEIGALISRNSFVCIYLIFVFSQLIDMSGTIGDIAAHTHRLGQVFETIDDKNSARKDEPAELSYENFMFDDEDKCLVKEDWNQSFPGTKKKEISEAIRKEFTSSYEGNTDAGDRVFFTLTEMSVYTPDNSLMLVDSLSLSINQGTNMLITGSTGSGKTTLLRILAGFFPPKSGDVKRWVCFGPRGVMYLPQKPLLTDGTLQEQITYPRSSPYPEYNDNENNERLRRVLDEVGLSDLVENYGGLSEKSEVNWSDKLSIGEMQRLSFARLLYHQPDLAVLDEPTSGLNEETENLLFNALKKRKITCVTVGHRRNLKQFHEVELKLLGDTKWELSPVTPDQSTEF